ncbi:MAG: hypothetical protein EA393_06300 [Bacteroidetes bacterium]|nr:MAG: hypothetical protein EA393_06300 [Bacteroidota bacterium]
MNINNQNAGKCINNTLDFEFVFSGLKVINWDCSIIKMISHLNGRSLIHFNFEEIVMPIYEKY